MRLCFFVSPHGFGHAARSAAVMSAIQRQQPGCEISVVTTIPEWFFLDSGVLVNRYHRIRSDVGFAQSSPTLEDVPATVALLRELLPFEGDRLQKLMELPGVGDADLIVSDIAPLGIAVAARAGIRSVLVENFTWDWIYKGHPEASVELLACADDLGEWFQRVDHRITCTPACEVVEGAHRVPPVGRTARVSRSEMRARLNIPENHKVVLVSMGGVQGGYSFEGRLGAFGAIATFIVAYSGDEMVRRGNLLLFPPRSPLYHPDLVTLADVVVGKAGYSTVAEAYYAGTGFAVVARPRFRESAILESFVSTNLDSLTIGEDEFVTGQWCERMPEILALSSRGVREGERRGGDEVAGIVLALGAGGSS